jgi:hypothetical protein
MIRAAALLFIIVLVCVPGLTRIGQKLQSVTPISSAPSFAKNIDCPPKKLTITPVAAIQSPTLVTMAEAARVECAAPCADASLPPAPSAFAPHPLRAPPVHPFL